MWYGLVGRPMTGAADTGLLFPALLLSSNMPKQVYLFQFQCPCLQNSGKTLICFIEELSEILMRSSLRTRDVICPSVTFAVHELYLEKH